MGDVIAMIPARYASSRLPGKPLASILGRPMIQRVWEQAQSAVSVNRVVVATDDERIASAVTDFGGDVVMTAPDCASGTDRLAQAADFLGAAADDIIVNVQGDQPFIDPRMIDETVRPLTEDSRLPMATLIHPIHRPEDLQDPGVVKTVIDRQGNSLYFSRSLIPAPHNSVEHTVYEHVGLYVYRRDFLATLSGLAPTILEQVEGLEQLRVLEHGYRLRCVITTCEDSELAGFSIDTADDLRRGEMMLQQRGLT